MSDKIYIVKEGEKEKDKVLTPNLYGEYKNISLTYDEYLKLKEQVKEHNDTMIDKLSRYVESSEKAYKNHYVTIINWYEQDKEKLITFLFHSGI